MQSRNFALGLIINRDHYSQRTLNCKKKEISNATADTFYIQSTITQYSVVTSYCLCSPLIPFQCSRPKTKTLNYSVLVEARSQVKKEIMK